MVQKTERAGQSFIVWALINACFISLCLTCPAYGWDTPARASENADGAAQQPRYNDILAEKVAQEQFIFEQDQQNALLNAALNPLREPGLSLRAEPGSAGSQAFGMRFLAGWDMPLNSRWSTGPVAQYAPGESMRHCLQCEFSDRVSPDAIASVGWRVDSRFGWMSPWMQLSYSYQLSDASLAEENARSADAAGQHEDNWLDVSVGAWMPINRRIAAFASFSQTGTLSSDEQFIYSLGLSASF